MYSSACSRLELVKIVVHKSHYSDLREQDADTLINNPVRCIYVRPSG